MDLGSSRRSSPEGASRRWTRPFDTPPTSTEQILHPVRYPGDVPVRVTIPNLAADFGSRWKLVDQMDVGEGFLRLLLGLRLRSNLADTAAAGWGGGEYRAWSDGVREAVLMETVWDSGSDADQFAAAMRAWLAEAPRPVVV